MSFLVDMVRYFVMHSILHSYTFACVLVLILLRWDGLSMSLDTENSKTNSPQRKELGAGRRRRCELFFFDWAGSFSVPHLRQT